MPNQISIQYHPTALGELMIGSLNDQLCLCDWRYRKMRGAVDKRLQQHLDASYIEQSSPVIKESIQQIDAYLSGKLKTFSIPLLLAGTNFQQSVREALVQIPYGTTCSYLELSKKLGDEKAIRAVAAANGANAISIIVPCHRIIGNDGKLIGYAGSLLAKQKLLQIEGININNQLNLF